MKKEIKDELEEFVKWCNKENMPENIVQKYIDWKLNNKLKHYVRFHFAGSLFSETSVVELTEEDFDVPKYSYGYDFYDMYENSGELNKSNMTYFGEVLTIEDVDKLNDDGNYDILMSNMRSNGYDKVIKTIVGNIQPFNEGDIAIPSTVYFREAKLKRILK